ncbi:hypothetical protein ACJJTC_000132 [Scirpophaga incertulas]
MKSQGRHMNEDVKKAYFLYFGCKIGDQDKQWAPHSSCVSCHVTLIQWLKGNRSSMPFAVHMVWREPTNHFNDCYFCLTNTEGYSKKKKKNIDYPTVPSAIKPVPHGEGLPVPTPPLNWEDLVIPELNDNEDLHSETAELLENTIDPTYIPPSSESHLIQQNELNDLARDLGLSKQQFELLGSRLQEWNLLAQGTTITSFRKRNANFSVFFKIEGPMCVYDNELGLTHISTEWRLFIDSSKSSLKAVLLHNGNIKPSIPVAYSVSMKETYDNLGAVLRAIKYEDFKWQICGVITGPDIREVIRDAEFENRLNKKELAAWRAFVKVVKRFLGNHRENNYKSLVLNRLKTYRAMGCRMSLKIHFLHSHIDFFPENLGAISDEQGERFHQDIATIETRYQGRWDPAMFGDYCCFLKKEDATPQERKK